MQVSLLDLRVLINTRSFATLPAFFPGCSSVGLERLVWVQEVAGSSPVIPTRKDTSTSGVFSLEIGREHEHLVLPAPPSGVIPTMKKTVRVGQFFLHHRFVVAVIATASASAASSGLGMRVSPRSSFTMRCIADFPAFPSPVTAFLICAGVYSTTGASA